MCRRRYNRVLSPRARCAHSSVSKKRRWLRVQPPSSPRVAPFPELVLFPKSARTDAVGFGRSFSFARSLPARCSSLFIINGVQLKVGFRRNDLGREFPPPAWNSILNPQNFPLAFIHQLISIRQCPPRLFGCHRFDP